MSITVTPVNDPPAATPQSVSTDEDTAKTVTLAGTDVDNAAASLSFKISSLPAQGKLYEGSSVVAGNEITAADLGASLSGNQVTYDPAPNYHGADSFNFKANDGSLDSAAATVSITVTPVNDPPDAVNDGGSVAEDSATGVLVDVLANDSTGPANESGQSLTITNIGTPSHGTAVLEAGQIRYKPTEANYNGPDSFTYTARDNGQSGSPAADDFKSDTATVSITVTSVNDAPSFTKGGNQTVNEDAGLQSVPAWATNISPGPANESGQSVSFVVTNDNNSLFSAPAGRCSEWNVDLYLRSKRERLRDGVCHGDGQRRRLRHECHSDVHDHRRPGQRCTELHQGR